MASTHLQKLKTSCRVCGCHFQRHKKTFSVKNYAKDLKECFWIATEYDIEDIHPKEFCDKCYFSFKNIKKGHAHSSKVVNWEPHKEPRLSFVREPMT